MLLKNTRNTTAGTPEGVTTRGLPLARERIGTVAVVGQDVKMPNLRCNDETMSVGWGSGSNSLEFIVPLIDAITAFVGTSAAVMASLSNDLDADVRAARGKDMAFVFANAMSGELELYTFGNQGDRKDLELWWKGGSLIERVTAVCNNTIVIIQSGGSVYMPGSTHPNNNEAAYVTSIVYNNPGFPEISYPEKLNINYHHMDAQNLTPWFEFGFGLSYTTFGYSALVIAVSGMSQGYLAYPVSAGELVLVKL